MTLNLREASARAFRSMRWFWRDKLQKNKMKLGDKVKDSVTGFTGIVTARTTFLHGCVRCGVQSDKLKDGKPVDAVWIDEPQLSLVKAAVVKEGKHDDGGPCPSTPQRAPDARR